MKVISRTAESDLAAVYIAENDDGKLIEFVESTQPPFTVAQKWVLIISTLYGCPVDCGFCDAGGSYSGVLSLEDLKFQIDYPVFRRFPDGIIDTDKFKIQFARMGEPAFNKNILPLLCMIPEVYRYRYFIPSLSTIAPHGCSDFLSELKDIKKLLYDDTFQLQFSIHSTDSKQRDELIPVRKWNFRQIADYADSFYSRNGKKITLNFALSTDNIIEPKILAEYFNPEVFLIKITPLNPTYKSQKNGFKSLIIDAQSHPQLIDKLGDYGYEVLVSIGEAEENMIGSNCGQYINKLKECNVALEGAYSYPLSPTF